MLSIEILLCAVLLLVFGLGVSLGSARKPAPNLGPWHEGFRLTRGMLVEALSAALAVLLCALIAVMVLLPETFVLTLRDLRDGCFGVLAGLLG